MSEDIKKALAKLEHSQSSATQVRDKSITAFEKMHGVALPKEYREFLLISHDGFFDNIIEFTPKNSAPRTTSDAVQYFDGFYGINELNEQIDRYGSRMPASLLPIGECPGGNLICLGVKEDVVGNIFYWNHENELEAKLILGLDTSTEDIDLYWENLYLVSDTFMDFLHGLEIVPDEDESMDDSGIDYVRMSDQFLSRLKK